MNIPERRSLNRRTPRASNELAHFERAMRLIRNFVTPLNLCLTTSSCVRLLDSQCGCGAPHSSKFVRECANHPSRTSFGLTATHHKMMFFGCRDFVRVATVLCTYRNAQRSPTFQALAHPSRPEPFVLKQGDHGGLIHFADDCYTHFLDRMQRAKEMDDDKQAIVWRRTILDDAITPREITRRALLGALALNLCIDNNNPITDFTSTEATGLSYCVDQKLCLWRTAILLGGQFAEFHCEHVLPPQGDHDIELYCLRSCLSQYGKVLKFAPGATITFQ